MAFHERSAAGDEREVIDQADSRQKGGTKAAERQQKGGRKAAERRQKGCRQAARQRVRARKDAFSMLGRDGASIRVISMPHASHFSQRAMTGACTPSSYLPLFPLSLSLSFLAGTKDPCLSSHSFTPFPSFQTFRRRGGGYLRSLFLFLNILFTF